MQRDNGALPIDLSEGRVVEEKQTERRGVRLNAFGGHVHFAAIHMGITVRVEIGIERHAVKSLIGVGIAEGPSIVAAIAPAGKQPATASASATPQHPPLA